MGWKQPFGHSDRHLSIALGMSVNTVRDARNRLMQLGLIDFKTPQKRSKGIDGQTKYVFPTVSTADTVLDTVSDTDIDTVSDTVLDTVSDTDIDTVSDTVLDTVSDTDIDTVSDTVLDTVSDTNNKLNKTKLNNSSPEDEPQKQKLKSFKKFSENDFSNSLKPFVETYGREMIRDFFDYWTEPSPSGKMKFQLNSTWDTEKRLRTWKKNEDKFGTKQTTQIKIKRNEL
ncbi:hypothetical protein CRP5_000002 [Riemerella phage vB_RanS_CRP5]|nr:hypothetical protein CRP5_000002 [Riemerella phage vB_RanS_CRP5]